MAISVNLSNQYLDRNTIQNISWSNSDATLNGKQTAYEIQYAKGSLAAGWSTLGKVSGATTSANLVSLFNAVGVDATEIYFRIKVYYDTQITSGNNIITGHEYSKDYVVMFHGTHIADLKIYDGTKVQSYPVFNDVDGVQTLDVAVSSSKTGKLPLVDSTNILASELKASPNGSAKHVGAGVYRNYHTVNSPTSGYFDTYTKRYYHHYNYQVIHQYYNVLQNYNNYSYFISSYTPYYYRVLQNYNNYSYFISSYTPYYYRVLQTRVNYNYDWRRLSSYTYDLHYYKKFYNTYKRTSYTYLVNTRGSNSYKYGYRVAYYTNKTYNGYQIGKLYKYSKYLYGYRNAYSPYPQPGGTVYRVLSRYYGTYHTGAYGPVYVGYMTYVASYRAPFRYYISYAYRRATTGYYNKVTGRGEFARYSYGYGTVTRVGNEYKFQFTAGYGDDGNAANNYKGWYASHGWRAYYHSTTYYYTTYYHGATANYSPYYLSKTYFYTTYYHGATPNYSPYYLSKTYFYTTYYRGFYNQLYYWYLTNASYNYRYITKGGL